MSSEVSNHVKGVVSRAANHNNRSNSSGRSKVDKYLKEGANARAAHAKAEGKRIKALLANRPNIDWSKHGGRRTRQKSKASRRTRRK